MRAFRTVALAALLLVALAACGGGKKGAPRPTSTPIPRFEEVVPPTTVPLLETAAATVQAGQGTGPEIDPTAVARGAVNWERLQCASCHGDHGQGGVGEINGVKAPSLIDMTLTEAEFIDWLRTGGSVGSAHLFSTDRLSDSGGRNLYQYVLSLSSGGASQ
jgi:mono/diheme cytochrome c family protein